MQLKVIDLGMAVMVKSADEKITGVVGTWGYHAPEMWDEKPYDAKADIFSLAITFLILVSFISCWVVWIVMDWMMLMCYPDLLLTNQMLCADVHGMVM